jgi:hypothetical protein
MSRFFGMVIFSFYSCSALAVLGETSSSVETLKTHFRVVTQSIKAQPLYTTQIVTSDNGTVITEDFNLKKQVFRVCSHGVSVPDLSLLLGNSYKTYEEAEPFQKSRGARSPRTIRGEDLVVDRFGHMGSVHMCAYRPSLLPDGLNIKDIK